MNATRRQMRGWSCLLAASLLFVLSGCSQSNVNGSQSVPSISSAKSEPKLNEPGKIVILVKERKFLPDKKTKALLVSYDDLDLFKVMNMKDVTMEAKNFMPDWLKDLDRKQIRIRGFMRPTWEAEKLKRFVLARDTQACCFGPNPKIDYLIDVQLKKDTTTNYIPESRAFDVVGTFRIEPEGEDSTLLGLYRIEDAQIIER